MASNYGYGRRKELQVGEFLERNGFEWGRAPGSRGPVDFVAKKGRRPVAVQVKSTRKDCIDYCAQISQKVWPVINKAAGDARNTTEPATSMGWPMRVDESSPA